MSQPAKAQEPSMEEILASIRRIIADDDASKAPAARPAPAPAAPPPPRPAAMPPRAPAPPPRPAAPPPPPPQPSLGQNDIDAMMGGHEPGAVPPANEPPDVLELTEAMAAAPESPIPSFQTIDGQADDVVFAEAATPVEPVPRVPEEPRRTPPPPASNGSDRSLLSPATSAAVDSAFNALAQTVLVHNARTLEDLVREMLRPMLKSWLDDNLPSMVERIVKAEIERVSRGRG